MGLLSKLFKKQPPKIDLPLVDVQTLIRADMHAHILPGIDDGAKTLDDSIAIIKELQEFGYESLLCTPHVMHDFYNNSTDKITSTLAIVKAELNRLNIEIEINAAAEYYFDEELTKRVREKDILTFGKEHYLLFEFSYFNEHQGVFEGITDMIQAGYSPVLAHPERYPYLVDQKEKYNLLRDLGAKFQINLMSLVGHYGESAQHGAEYLIEQNYVDFIGTDIHRIEHLPKIEKALKNEHLHQLMQSGLLNKSL